MADEDPIVLDKDDVKIEPFEIAVCDECDEAPATHVITVDWRNTGTTFGIGKFCEPCAKEQAERMREALPPPKET